MLGARDLLRRLGAADVEDLDRLVHQLGQRDGAVRRLPLDDAGRDQAWYLGEVMPAASSASVRHLMAA